MLILHDNDGGKGGNSSIKIKEINIYIIFSISASMKMWSLKRWGSKKTMMLAENGMKNVWYRRLYHQTIIVEDSRGCKDESDKRRKAFFSCFVIILYFITGLWKPKKLFSQKRTQHSTEEQWNSSLSPSPLPPRFYSFANMFTSSTCISSAAVTLLHCIVHCCCWETFFGKWIRC